MSDFNKPIVAQPEIVVEEVLLTFRTKSGKDLLINPFDQASIDAAKAEAPGEGIGPEISAHLIGMIGRGLVTDAGLLPAEYRHLFALFGTTSAQAVFGRPPSQAAGRASRGCPVPMTGKRPDSL